MSGSANLGINITARDAASGEIKGLQSAVKGLEASLKQLSAIGANANAASAASIKRETDAIKQKIEALNQEITTKLQGSTAGIRQAQQEAEYINRNIELIKAQQRALAEYSNQQAIAADRQMRQLAEYENAQRTAAARTQARSAAGIIAGASPSSAAAAAAAAASLAGKTGPEIEAAAVKAATAARLRQKAAIDAVAMAMREAARAGASEAEVEIAGARAATAALRAKNIESSGGGGGLGASLLQRESRHIIGLFDSLARGQRGQAVSSIGAAARDAGLGVGALGASMAGLVAIMGTSAIIHGAESMGRWATETRAAASAAGMSLKDYSALQGAMTLTGIKAEEADTALRRLAINLSTAIADPASMAAQAFHNIGISQEDLIKTSGDVSKGVDLLAKAFAATADSANKSANFNEIAGKGFEKLFVLIQNGSTSMAEMKAKAEALGITLNEETAPSLEKTGQKADELAATIRGQGIKAFVTWGDTIQRVIGIVEALGSAIGKVSSVVAAFNSVLSPIVNAPSNFSNWMANKGRSVGKGILGGLGLPDYSGDDKTGTKTGTAQFGPPGPKTEVPPLVHGQESVLEKMRHDAAQAAEAASRGAKSAQAARQAEGKAEIAVMQEVLKTATLSAKQRDEIETEIAHKTTSMRNSQLSADGAAANKAAKQAYADFAAAEKLKVAEADKSASQIAAIYDEWLSAAESRYKQHASVILSIEKEKVQAVNAARLSEIKEGAQQTEQSNRLSGLNATLSQMQRGEYNFGGSSQNAAALQKQSSQALAEAALVKSAADQEIAALTQVRDTATQGSATQKQASAEIMSVLLQSKAQEIELYKKAGQAAQQAADKAAEGFKKFFDSVGQGFETFSSSVLKSLIAPQQEIIKAGLTSITKNMRGNEIQQAFGQLATHMLSSLGNSIQEAIGSTIAKALSGGVANTMGELLSQTFSKVLGSVTGGAIGSAAGQAVGGAAGNAAVSAAIAAAATAETTGISGAIVTAATTQVTAITTSAASIVTAIGAAATTTALAAQIPKPFGFSGGGIVPSAAGGMVLGDGMGGQMAILHPQEMVLPAHLSKGIQGMINGAGAPQAGGPSQTNNLNYSPNINTASRSRSGTGMSRAEFSQMMSLHSGSMLGEARNMMRSGWRPA